MKYRTTMYICICLGLFEIFTGKFMIYIDIAHIPFVYSLITYGGRPIHVLNVSYKYFTEPYCN